MKAETIAVDLHTIKRVRVGCLSCRCVITYEVASEQLLAHEDRCPTCGAVRRESNMAPRSLEWMILHALHDQATVPVDVQGELQAGADVAGVTVHLEVDIDDA